MSTFAQTLDQILDTYWRLHPIEATHTGIHTHDAAMPDWSSTWEKSKTAKLLIPDRFSHSLQLMMEQEKACLRHHFPRRTRLCLPALLHIRPR